MASDPKARNPQDDPISSEETQDLELTEAELKEIVGSGGEQGSGNEPTPDPVPDPPPPDLP